MDPVIRPLSPDDAVTTARLQNALWRSTYAGLLPQDLLDARDDEANAAVWRARAEHHERHGTSPEGGRTLVAHDAEDRPIGWVTTGPPRDDDPPNGTEVWSLYVAEEYQGSGVATRLLEAVPPSSSAHLWVLRGNARAIAFYRKVGFEVDGTVKEDPRLGAEELRMVRRAGPSASGRLH